MFVLLVPHVTAFLHSQDPEQTLCLVWGQSRRFEHAVTLSDSPRGADLSGANQLFGNVPFAHSRRRRSITAAHCWRNQGAFRGRAFCRSAKLRTSVAATPRLGC